MSSSTYAGGLQVEIPCGKPGLHECAAVKDKIADLIRKEAKQQLDQIYQYQNSNRQPVCNPFEPNEKIAQDFRKNECSIPANQYAYIDIKSEKDIVILLDLPQHGVMEFAYRRGAWALALKRETYKLIDELMTTNKFTSHYGCNLTNPQGEYQKLIRNLSQIAAGDSGLSVAAMSACVNEGEKDTIRQPASVEADAVERGMKNRLAGCHLRAAVEKATAAFTSGAVCEIRHRWEEAYQIEVAQVLEQIQGKLSSQMENWAQRTIENTCVACDGPICKCYSESCAINCAEPLTNNHYRSIADGVIRQELENKFISLPAGKKVPKDYLMKNEIKPIAPLEKWKFELDPSLGLMIIGSLKRRRKKQMNLLGSLLLALSLLIHIGCSGDKSRGDPRFPVAVNCPNSSATTQNQPNTVGGISNCNESPIPPTDQNDGSGGDQVGNLAQSGNGELDTASGLLGNPNDKALTTENLPQLAQNAAARSGGNGGGNPVSNNKPQGGANFDFQMPQERQSRKPSGGGPVGVASGGAGGIDTPETEPGSVQLAEQGNDPTLAATGNGLSYTGGGGGGNRGGAGAYGGGAAAFGDPSDSTKPGEGSGAQTGVDFGAAGSEGAIDPMKTLDPENYFAFTSVSDDLFRIVERRYRRETQEWSMQTTDAALQSAGIKRK